MKKIITAILIIFSVYFLIGCTENIKVTGNTNEDILQFLKSAEFLNNIGKDNLRIEILSTLMILK